MPIQFAFVLGVNGDTLLTGFSGVVILVIVVWLVLRAIKKRG
jgi:hypothetical protein